MKPSRKNRPTARPHSVRISLSEREYRALEEHCRCHRVESKARWMREVIMLEILKQAECSSPLLFAEEDMRTR